jgi:hypothetical protein
MSSPSDRVFHTEVLLLEIVSFLNVAALGRLEQTACAFRSVSQSAWKLQATKIRGHSLSMMMRGDHRRNNYYVGGGGGGGDETAFKEQVRRYYVSRKYTRSLAHEHRRHFLQGSTYTVPRLEPELPPNCSFCSVYRYPNLKTSTLLSQYVDSYAFFVRMGVLKRQDKQQVAPKPILEDVLAIQEVIPNANGKYVTLRLSLRDSSLLNRWPPLSHFLEWCRFHVLEESRLQHPGYMQDWFPKFSRQLLSKLEVAVTAVDLKTGKAALLLATGGGNATSTDILSWRLLRRMADSHPTPAAFGFGDNPTVESRISFLPDYSNLEAIEITISTNA